jgi:hypothetical protein
MAITVVRRLQTEERNRLAGKEKASRRGGLKGNARLSEDRYPRSQLRLSGRDFGDSITRTGVASGKSLERAGSLESRFLKSNGRLPVRTEPELTVPPVQNRSALVADDSGAID